jgi:transposase
MKLASISPEKDNAHITLMSLDWTYLSAHEKRGHDAMDDIDILPQLNGVMCHDHWKPYYRYEYLHLLCNTHHLRELTRAYEQDNQAWAEEMRVCLVKLNQELDEADRLLSGETQARTA